MGVRGVKEGRGLKSADGHQDICLCMPKALKEGS